jgi:phytoene desaturase
MRCHGSIAATALTDPMSTAPHAIVIGSGFGGLAAAIRLGARGYRVTVLERLDAPGGRAYVYRQNGFTFDAGPTIITAPFLLEELWGLCGRTLSQDVDLQPISPFYQIRFADGETFNYSGDPAAMRREVARFSPGDVAGYDRFMSISESIYKVGFEQLGHRPFDSWRDMLRILPQMLRLKSHLSVYKLVAREIKDPRLRVVFSFHPLLIGGNPFTATCIYSLIAFLERRWGVHFAMGGTGKLIQGLVGLLEGQGGSLHINHDVESIRVRNGAAIGVRLKDGRDIDSDIVVSNADPAWTYGNLLPKLERGCRSRRKVDGARYSMSLFVWYFGTKRRYDEVAHHTILLGPRYKDLLGDIFKRKVLAKDFSLYLHRPTATDPSLAPPGCDAFYVLSPVPHLQSGINWHDEAEKYRCAIAEHLQSTLLPDLQSNIVTSRMVTPLDFQDRLQSLHGAAFGMEPILTQSAWFRPHNRSTQIRQLFLVGAGTHPGAGVPGVLSSAKVLDSVVPHGSVFC